MKLRDKIKPAAPPMEAGTYLGVCIGVVGLGEQETRYKSQTQPKYVSKIKFIFEIPDETIEQDGEQCPRQLSTEFSVARKATSRLRQFLSSWMGKVLSDDEYLDMEFNDLIGRNAILNVVRSEDDQYANIVSAMPLMKGVPPVTATAEPIRFDADEWDDAAFERLPEYLQERLKKSMQYKMLHLPETEVSVEAAEAAAFRAAEADAPREGRVVPF